MAIDAETAEPPVYEYTSPTSSGTPRSTSPAVASSEEVVPASSSATAATAAKPVRERIFAIPPWRGATRGSSATPAATRTRATLVSRPDTVTPPPAVTTSEAARPSPILTTEARPTPNEPRAIEARTTRVRNYVIPPWTGASRDNSSAAAAATATTTTPAAAAATTATPAPVSSPDAATPPPATAEAETTQPSPVTTTGALPTPEEIDALEAIMSWVRTYVIHPRTEASRGTTSTAPTATPAVCPDAATPSPASTESEPAAVSTTAVPTTLEEPSAMETLAARVRTYVIPPWAGASRDNSTTAAPATPPTEALATVTAAISPDTATPPPTPTESEGARPPPISTMDAPTTLEQPSAMETLAARVRTCVIPPWAGTSRNNSTTAAPATPPTAASATATVAISPDTATPLPATTASEAARPSPISTLDARSPTHEEPLAMDPRPARRRTYVIPPWAGASRNNSTTAAPATPSTPNVTTSTALVVTCPDTATPPPAYTASETAPPSPISTTDTRPTLEEEEEPRAMDPRPARLRTYVTPPWAGALRDNIAIAAAAAPTREAERELTRAEAQAIVDAADMAAAEEVVAANEAADALAIAQAVAESETAGTPADVGGRGGGRGGDGGRISLALHHRVRQARERASSTCSEQVRGSVRHEDMRLDPGWRTDGDVGRGRFSRARPGRVRIASSSSDQATERASDAETELSSGTLTELDERHAVLVQQDRVTLPRGRAASISSEQAALRASDDAEVDVDSGSQTEGDEGDGGRVLVAQERGRLSRGHGMRRLGNEPREHAKDDASSTLAVATESILRRRAQSCPPACERPPPPTAVAEPGDAGSGGEAGEQTSPNTQVASTQTDTEGEGSDSPAVEVADAQTGTEEEALEAPTAEVAEVQTEEEIEAATEAEAEAEAEAEDGGMALGGSGGTVFPIVREDPDTGAAAFRSSSCAECQSLIVDALAHRDAVGMKGKVSAGLNADRCRNCWRVVCDSCIGTCWPRTMVPRMYTRDSDSHRMRVCKTCHCAMEMFRKSLLLGRVEEAMAAYGTGCVNLDTPYTTYHGELPVHCAAAGGNVVLLSWLVDELGCSLFVDDDLKKPLRDLRDLTVLGAAAVNVQVQTMRYLVNTKRCSLHEITHLPTLKKALEACLHDSPETMLSLGASGSGPFGQLSYEIITDISLRADGERSSYVDRGGPIGVSAVFATASGFDDADDCCIVCFDNEVSCTLVPCGHHCCCRDCAARLKHCPVCRAGITEIIKAIPV